MSTLKKIWVEATLKNLRWHPIKIWVDFTGYPSNHFSGCSLNGRIFENKKDIFFLLMNFHVSFSGYYNYYKRPINFLSNGKPINIFQLKKTTTSTTTTTTTPEPDTLSRKQDSTITWLGNFFMNGLPKKLFNFKAPYSPLSWFSKLKDDGKKQQRQQPSQNILV